MTIIKNYSNYFSVLKHSPLFRGISEGEIATICECLNFKFKGYKRGEFVFSAGDSVRDIGIVAEGRVHIRKNDIWGNSNIIMEIASGEMFGEAIACGEIGVLPVDVIAENDSVVCFINFEQLSASCPSACAFHSLLIRNMLSVFARKNAVLTDKMEHITKRTTREKLLSYLSGQAARRGKTEFYIPFDRQGLADFLSVERSALSAEMSRLKADGIIDYHKNHFILAEGGRADKL